MGIRLLERRVCPCGNAFSSGAAIGASCSGSAIVASAFSSGAAVAIAVFASASGAAIGAFTSGSAIMAGAFSSGAIAVGACSGRADTWACK